jgi:hypothetical protein
MGRVVSASSATGECTHGYERALMGYAASIFKTAGITGFRLVVGPGRKKRYGVILVE